MLVYFGGWTFGMLEIFELYAVIDKSPPIDKSSALEAWSARYIYCHLLITCPSHDLDLLVSSD
jgi:hypothetical protein